MMQTFAAWVTLLLVNIIVGVVQELLQEALTNAIQNPLSYLKGNLYYNTTIIDIQEQKYFTKGNTHLLI